MEDNFLGKQFSGDKAHDRFPDNASVLGSMDMHDPDFPVGQQQEG
jgi:hypothetical protein